MSKDQLQKHYRSGGANAGAALTTTRTVTSPDVQQSGRHAASMSTAAVADSNPDNQNDALAPTHHHNHNNSNHHLMGNLIPSSFFAAGSALAKVSSYLPTQSSWFVSPAAAHSQEDFSHHTEVQSAATLAEVRENATRDTRITDYMSRRESEYIVLQDINIFVGTWNVNGRAPNEPIDAWIKADLDDRSSGLPESSGFFAEKELMKHPNPDMFIFGFQELDLSTEAYVFTASMREQEWRLAVEEALRVRTQKSSKNPEVHLVRCIRLVGMMLLVYVTTEHKPHIRRVAAAQVGTGIMGRMGNKGGVAIRFEFHNTSICVLNAHLSAGGTSQVFRRNEDFRAIMQRLVFMGEDRFEAGILDHDLVIWLGDLNYRIKRQTRAQVEAMIAENRLVELTDQDELLDEMKAGRAFAQFQEARIEYIPTYKYDVGTCRFDTSGKVRVPAWCDRVLWLGPKSRVRPLMYVSVPSLLSSDHKPVVARLQCGVKVVDNALYKRVYENVLKHMDRLENDELPIVKVDRQEFDFGDVAFLDEVNQTLNIANIGQCKVRFDFVKGPNNKTSCKSWLSIQPHGGTLEPRDIAEVQLTMHIDKRAAPELNAGRELLEDLLILRLAGGRDFFIVIKARYMPTSFGQPLDVLIDRYWNIAVRDAEPMVNKIVDVTGIDDDPMTTPPPIPPRRPRSKLDAVVDEAPLIDLSSTEAFPLTTINNAAADSSNYADDLLLTPTNAAINPSSLLINISGNNNSTAAIDANLADNPTTDIAPEAARRIMASSYAQLLAQAHAEKTVPFELLWLLWDLYCRCVHGCRPTYTKYGLVTGGEDAASCADADERASITSSDLASLSASTATVVASSASSNRNSWAKFDDDFVVDDDDFTSASSTLSSSNGSSSQASLMRSEVAQLFQKPGLEAETRAIRDALDTRKIVILTDAASISLTLPSTTTSADDNNARGGGHKPLARCVVANNYNAEPTNQSLIVKVLYKLSKSDGSPPPPPWPLLPGSMHSVAEMLLIFLEALPDSLVPSALYAEAVKASSNFHHSQFGAIAEHVMPRLHRYNRASLVCLMALLRELTGAGGGAPSSKNNNNVPPRSFHAPVYGGVNSLKASIIESIFGQLVLRPPPSQDLSASSTAPSNSAHNAMGANPNGVRNILARKQEEEKKAAFVKFFLANPSLRW